MLVCVVVQTHRYTISSYYTTCREVISARMYARTSDSALFKRLTT